MSENTSEREEIARIIEGAIADAAAGDWEIARDEAADKIIARRLPALDGEVLRVLDAASEYLKTQYGLGALSHPIDRQRILALLASQDHRKADAARVEPTDTASSSPTTKD